MLTSLLATLLIQTAAAACPSSDASLQSTLDSAQLAFSMMDSGAFSTATADAEAQASCLSDPVSTTVAARLQRVLGLQAFVSGDEGAARKAFAAARAIEPDYQFPDSMVPADHPVRQLYSQSLNASGASAELPVPAAGHLEFDGTAGTRRPTERPTLALLVDTRGAVSNSGYLWPEDPVFSYAPAAAATVATTKEPKATPTRHGPNLPLTIVAAASLVAGGTCYGLAAAAHNEFDAAVDERDVLEPLRAKTNTFYFTSIGATVVGLGTGIGAVVAGHW